MKRTILFVFAFFCATTSFAASVEQEKAEAIAKQAASSLPKLPSIAAPTDAQMKEAAKKAAEAEKEKHCEKSGGHWVVGGRNPEACLNQAQFAAYMASEAKAKADAAECKKQGGAWGGHSHWDPAMTCFIPAKDAKKACQSNADCLSIFCVHTNPETKEHGECTDGSSQTSNCSAPDYFNSKDGPRGHGPQCVE